MANNLRAKQFLSWAPIIGLNEGLEKVYDWCKAKLL